VRAWHAEPLCNATEESSPNVHHTEVAATDDGLHFATGEIKEQGIAQCVKRAGLEQTVGQKLPPVTRGDSFVAEREPVLQPASLRQSIVFEKFQHPLRDERAAHQRHQ
jgi:hypothetical protein